MKPYGYKKAKKPKGDGCFLCTQERKTTKTAVRNKTRLKIKEEENGLLHAPIRGAKKTS